MRTGIKVLLVSVSCLLPFCPGHLAAGSQSQDLSEEDYTALGMCEGVIQLFKQFPDAVWPGYNLAERPFMFYMPGRWALLLNYSGEIEGFTPYPEDWPDLGTEVMLHEGQYKDLVGQLAFNLQIDTLTGVSGINLPV